MSWRTVEGTARASSPRLASSRHPPSSRRALPSSTQESTTFSRKSGLPPVRSASAPASSGGGSAPGRRARRYSATSSSPRAATATRAQSPRATRSATVAWTGWARVAASADRSVPTTISRAGSRRRAVAARNASVEGSLHCRSSSRRTIGRSAAAASSASTTSRSIRAWVAPRTRPSTRASSSGATSQGIWMIQVGARSTRIAVRASPPGSRQRRPTASSTGMYASEGPCCSTHWPRPISGPPGPAALTRNASTRVVFPAPASPVTIASCGTPAAAASSRSRSSARSTSRPTSGPPARAGAARGRGEAGGGGASPGSCCRMRRSRSRSADDGSMPSSSDRTRRASW